MAAGGVPQSNAPCSRKLTLQEAQVLLAAMHETTGKETQNKANCQISSFSVDALPAAHDDCYPSLASSPLGGDPSLASSWANGISNDHQATSLKRKGQGTPSSVQVSPQFTPAQSRGTKALKDAQGRRVLVGSHLTLPCNMGSQSASEELLEDLATLLSHVQAQPQLQSGLGLRSGSAELALFGTTTSSQASTLTGLNPPSHAQHWRTSNQPGAGTPVASHATSLRPSFNRAINGSYDGDSSALGANQSNPDSLLLQNLLLMELLQAPADGAADATARTGVSGEGRQASLAPPSIPSGGGLRNHNSAPPNLEGYPSIASALSQGSLSGGSHQGGRNTSNTDCLTAIDMLLAQALLDSSGPSGSSAVDGGLAGSQFVNSNLALAGQAERGHMASERVPSRSVHVRESQAQCMGSGRAGPLSESEEDCEEFREDEAGQGYDDHLKKDRVTSERERRHRISDGLRELRRSFGGRGNNAIMLQQAVAYIQGLEAEVKHLREKVKSVDSEEKKEESKDGEEKEAKEEPTSEQVQ